MTPRTVIEGALLGLLGGVLIVWWRPGGCEPPPAALLPRIEAVVRARNGMAADASLTLVKDTQLQGSCVRRLIFTDGNQERFGILLSPDHRWALSRPTDLSLPPRAAATASRAPGVRGPSAPAAIPTAAFAALLQGDPPTRGPSGGATVVEFADFECPYCQREAGTLERLQQRGMPRFRLVWRQFPLPIHPWAEKAAELSVCAAQQNQAAFWRLHDYLFAHQAQIDPANLTQQAVQALPAGAARKQLLACAASPAARVQVASDLALGKKLGVGGTPTLFINGTAVVGTRSQEELAAILARGH